MVAQRAGKLFPRGAIAMQLGVILLLCAAVVPNAALTSADVEWYTTEIVNIIEDDRDLLPKFVRLSFHDCVGVGGCNGCVDMGNVDNAGLNIPIDALEAIFTSESNNSPSASISRADLWALAGLVSAHRAAELAQGTVPDFTFRYGRTDCATSPDGDGSDVLPSASSLGTDEVFAFFDDKFGFTQEDTVALMGAHTLGRCSKENSGFEGPWTRRPHRLDNEYYARLARPWRQVSRDLSVDNCEALGMDAGCEVFQWRQGGGGGGGGGRDLIMLNTDMALFIDIDPQDSGRVTGNCRRSARCEDGPTEGLVEDFADDNDVWLTAFEDVFVRMVEKCDGCQLTSV
eukprot:jgi/Tetstr1/427711/TSEL_017836.t1